MSHSSAHTIKLPKELTQPQLNELKEAVDKPLKSGKMVQFDAESIERVDGSGLQFLIAFAASQEESKSTQPILQNASDLLHSAISDFGTDSQIAEKLFGQAVPANKP